MNAESANTALATFEAKWSLSRPELAVALRFLAPDRRAMQSAFACLVLEIEHTSYDLAEPSVAIGKLQWWAAELLRSAEGAPQHPVTRVLANHPAFGGVPWSAVIAGAMAQRDAPTANNLDALLAGHERLFAPLAAAEAMLCDGIDADVTLRSRCLARALRQTATLVPEARTQPLSLPLDLLARHQLTRGVLAQAGPARTAALREHLSALLEKFDALAARPSGLSLMQVAGVSADRARARHALRARDPLAALAAALTRLPSLTAWKVWRCARRQDRRAG